MNMDKLKLSLQVFCFFFFALLLLQKSHAFTFNNSVGAAFAQDPVTINVATNCVNLGITTDELMSITKDAIDQFWNQVSTSKLELKLGSQVSVDSAFRTEAICTPSGNSCIPNTNLTVSEGILIACNIETGTNFPDDAILGITLPNNIKGTTLNGALFLINDRASNSFQNKSRAQMVSIVAHELGHAIGLGHSPVEDSLMYYTLVPVRDKLGWDDVDGVTYLYPKEQPLACGSLTNVNSDYGKTLAILLFLSLLFLKLYGRKEQPRLEHSSSY